jgi:hypothetical protein
MRGFVSLWLLIAGCESTDPSPAPPWSRDLAPGWRTPDLHASPPRDGGAPDLHVRPPDLSSLRDLAAADTAPRPDLGGGVGSACDSAGDCAIPGFCWRAPSGKGICTRSCVSDGDCGASASCLEYSTGWFCARDCVDSNGCPDGFACFVGQGCYPADILDCDPRVAACNTSETGEPGGCVRYALGAGESGLCFASCHVGAGSCPPEEGGWPQSCVVFDATLGGDAFKGPICVPSDPVANPIGFPCLDDAGRYSPWACADGSQCDLYSVDADGLCHALCEESPLQAQQQTASCRCVDAFGLFGSATPVGLCR